jgi:hypothetical protein
MAVDWSITSMGGGRRGPSQSEKAYIGRDKGWRGEAKRCRWALVQDGRDFRGQQGDMITLVKMGAGWVEKCRSVNSSAP